MAARPQGVLPAMAPNQSSSIMAKTMAVVRLQESASSKGWRRQDDVQPRTSGSQWLVAVFTIAASGWSRDRPPSKNRPVVIWNSTCSARRLRPTFRRVKIWRSRSEVWHAGRPEKARPGPSGSSRANVRIALAVGVVLVDADLLAGGRAGRRLH